MSHSTLHASEPNSTSALVEKPGVLVARKHHLLVRWSHWLNLPILLGLILSGVSIYWASPVYQHKPDPNTGNVDVAADIGIWICTHVPGLHHYGSPPDWLYNHMEMRLAQANWQINIYSDAKHSFTGEGSAGDRTPEAGLHPQTEVRSWQTTIEFLREVFKQGSLSHC